MLLRNIEKLVKQTGFIDVILTRENVWIRNGFVTAPLFDFKTLTEEQCCLLFNIPPEKKKNYVITLRGLLPDEKTLIRDEYADEEPLPAVGPVIRYGGCEAVPFMTARGVVYAELKDLQPFFKEDDKTRFYARWTEEYMPTIAAKSGMLLKGLIRPIEGLITPEFCDWLAVLAEETKAVREFGYTQRTEG